MSWIALSTTVAWRKHAIHTSIGWENERTFNLLGIRCACIVRVDLLCRRALVEADETVEEVVARGVVAVAADVVREVVAERGVRELRGEQVDLVEEEDDRGPHEPARVADGVEERERFLHPVLR